MKRRFFWFVTAMLCGIAFTVREQYIVLNGLIAFFAISSFLCFFPFLRGWGMLALSIFIGLLLGAVLFTLQFSAYQKEVLPFCVKESFTITGRVEKTSVTSQGKIRLLLDGEKRYYLYFTKDAGYTVGDILTFEAPVLAAEKPENFGESDLRLYMMSQKVHGSVFCDEIEITKTGRDFRLTRFGDLMHVLREKMTRGIREKMPPDAQGFMLALITGDSSGIYLEERANLSAAGLSHIVAVSGMHLQGIVQAFMVLFGLMKLRRRPIASIICLLAAWFFVGFTGASPSVLRAALMLTVCFAAIFFGKENDGLTALAVSVFVLTLQNTAMLFDISFQLSCASTLSILLYAGKLEAKFSLLPTFLRQSISISLAATIGFMLPAAYQFGMVSTVGILANIFVCPLSAPLLIGGFLSTFFAPIPFLGDALFYVLTKMVRYILWMAEFFANLPHAQLGLSQPNPITALCYLLFAKAVHVFLGGKRRQAVRILNAALIVLFLYLAKDAFGTAKITFLNVGNSDCALVSYQGKHFLFDGGGALYSDVGTKTVLPYLQRCGIDKIDMAFLTHYHQDHAAGFVSLLQNGYIGHLALPYHADISLKYEIMKTAKLCGVPITILKDGDIFRAGDIEVAAFDTACMDEENNGLLYRLTLWETRVLFTGDITKSGERKLVWRGADIDSDILKVPHHGAATSDTALFTEAVTPSLAVLSTGENSYQHPHPDTLKIYAEKSIPILRTDENGSISVTISKNGIGRIKTLY